MVAKGHGPERRSGMAQVRPSRLQSKTNLNGFWRISLTEDYAESMMMRCARSSNRQAPLNIQ